MQTLLKFRVIFMTKGTQMALNSLTKNCLLRQKILEKVIMLQVLKTLSLVFWTKVFLIVALTKTNLSIFLAIRTVKTKISAANIQNQALTHFKRSECKRVFLLTICQKQQEIQIQSCFLIRLPQLTWKSFNR